MARSDIDLIRLVMYLFLYIPPRLAATSYWLRSWPFSRASQCEFFFALRIRLSQFRNNCIILYLRCKGLALKFYYFFLELPYRIGVILPEVFRSYCCPSERKDRCRIDGSKRRNSPVLEVDNAQAITSDQKNKCGHGNEIVCKDDMLPDAHFNSHNVERTHL